MATVSARVTVGTSVLVTFLINRTTSVSLAHAFYCSLGLCCTGWFIYWTYLFPLYFSPLRHIPTVPGNPILGHGYIRLANEIGVPEREWHNKYGNIVRFFLIFGIERLSIADHEALRNINVRNPYDFVKPSRTVRWMRDILGPRGILLVEGLLHVRQRKAVAPAFSTSSIQALEPKFWEKGLLLTQQLSKEVRRSNSSSSPVQILGWLNRATLDVIAATAFDYDVNSLQDPDVPLAKAYASVFAFDLASCIIQGLRLYFGFAKYLPFQMNRSMDESSKLVADTATTILRGKLDASANSVGAKDIISLVVKHNQALSPSDPDRLSFPDIRDQVMTFLGAGHDTTATGVAWTLELLSKHPEIQTRLRNEILSAFPQLRHATAPGFADEKGPRTPDPSALASSRLLDTLPYLQKVCAESLRLIPPIPTTIREARVDAVLGGYAVPRGTNFFMNANAVNHLRCYWGEDAGVFDPDRWDGRRGAATTTTTTTAPPPPPPPPPSEAFLTFLEGPRGCIGRKFAETEMKVFVCCLLANFAFAPDRDWPDQEARKMWRLVLRPKDGIRLRMSLLEA